MKTRKLKNLNNEHCFETLLLLIEFFVKCFAVVAFKWQRFFGVLEPVPSLSSQ